MQKTDTNTRPLHLHSNRPYVELQITNMQKLHKILHFDIKILTGICFPVFWSTRKHLNSNCKCGLSSPFVPGTEHKIAIISRKTESCVCNF